ncbi:MAG: hypothetical protein RLZZ15_59 [Verrucomicrobiota bacterium]
MKTMRRLLAGLAIAVGSTAGFALRGQGLADYESPPVSYSAATPRDAFAVLQKKIAAGEIALAGEGKQAVLAVLEALDVPVASQTLVFSKTSLQRDRIRPARPRALYFSDSVYVGWVPGGLIEIAAVDPTLGPIFYALDPAALRRGHAAARRDDDCLRCHGGTFVREIPGVFVRSLFADGKGEPLLRHGSMIVEDDTPFEQRWGGWYVTGFRGTATHRGNAFATEKGDQLVFAPATARPDELAEYFDTSGYLRPTSDVAALLVFEHQLAMQNALTRAGLSCQKMIAYQRGLQTAFKEPLTDEPAYDSVKSVFAGAVQSVVDRLLFRGAAALPDGVVGGAEFRGGFAASAPRSRAGHALKDLDLHGKIFAQRCSYLIYSESFRALPPPLKTRILDRLQAVLLGREPGERYAYLPAEERARIYAILVETHPDAQARWTADAAPGRK